ncbi:MAG: hypothetical protein HFG49_03025 [Lachnospiraceae bacterium]|nr:hypothetical protein [Lachnospiraceae bacterium]
MGGMVETVRLFRKKEEDTWAVFMLEFFKMIGCITSDYILPVQMDKVDSMFAAELTEPCDVTILWNLRPQEIDEIMAQFQNGNSENFISVNVVREKEKNSKTFQYFQNSGKQTFAVQILNKIWKNNRRIRNEILFLLDAYTKSDLFFYWYNKGNLKFVQEYYPLKGIEGRNTDKRKEAYQITFEKGFQCYNKLISKENEYRSYYYRFALIHLQHELNSIGGLMSGKFVFYAQNLLEQAKQLKSDYPEQIRIHYLQAAISETDSLFLWDAEAYYLNAILKFEKKYPKGKIGYFLYYKLGKYYEKKRKNIEKAEIYYRMAVEYHPTEFRSLYKIGKIEEQKRHYNAAAKAANDIIKNVLNGYELSKLMPKEQIYIYKSYVLLGDIFSSRGFYTHAIVGYRRALKVSDSTSSLFQIFEGQNVGSDNNKFEAVMKSCMPKQAVYRKMINVASKTNNVELVDECFVGMNRGE